MSHLILVRHGQSEWNLQNRFTGWVDVDLAPKGKLEACKAGDSVLKRQSADRGSKRTGEAHEINLSDSP